MVKTPLIIEQVMMLMMNPILILSVLIIIKNGNFSAKAQYTIRNIFKIASKLRIFLKLSCFRYGKAGRPCQEAVQKFKIQNRKQ
jgi:hypothetical protein